MEKQQTYKETFDRLRIILVEMDEIFQDEHVSFLKKKDLSKKFDRILDLIEDDLRNKREGEQNERCQGGK